MAREAFLEQIREHFPSLLPFACQFYLHETDLIIWDAKGSRFVKLRSRSGMQQGDTMGSFYFALGLHPVLEEISAHFDGRVVVRAIADDVHLLGTDDDVAEAYVMLKRGVEALKMALSYGPRKTCAWSPAWEQTGGADGSRLLAALRADAPPDAKETVRCRGGMEVLGSFVGSDAYITQAVLDKVQDATPGEGGVLLCAKALAALAEGDVANGRDGAGTLLRLCLTSRVGYLCRTVRPDLMACAAAVADNILCATFARVWDVPAPIFSPHATALWGLAGARVRAPTSLRGCGIRSAAVTSAVAYLAGWRAVAARVAASSPEAATALGSIDGASASPAVRAIRVAHSSLPDLVRTEVDLEAFAGPDPPPAHLQRTLNHAAEEDALSEALDKVQLLPRDRAHFNSCDGRWLRAARLPYMQLTNGEAATRMQRYLRLPLACARGLRVGKDGKEVDPYGDNFLSTYKALGANEWILAHNQQRDLLGRKAKQAGLEGVTVDKGGAIEGSDDKPDDVRLPFGSETHGWKAAGTKEVLVDVTWVSAVCDKHVAAAARVPGGAASEAMAGKHTRYRDTIMSHQFLQPLAMESEGQMCAEWEEMLLALAKKWAERRLRDDKAARRMQGYWLDELAVIHARYLARCLINRATACKGREQVRAEVPPTLAELDVATLPVL